MRLVDTAREGLLFREFEREVLVLLAADALSPQQLLLLAQLRDEGGYEHTGVGYFVTVRDEGLPAERAALSLPGLSGSQGIAHCGFVVFLGDHELTLECHTWDGGPLPADFRENAVRVRLTPGEASVF